MSDHDPRDARDPREPRDTRDPRDLPDSTPDDDPTAARLRAALTAEAAMVQPDDSLSSIRERTGSERAWWQRPAVLATAAAVVLGLAVGGAAALLGGSDDPTVATPGGKGSTSAPAPTESTPSETASTSEGTSTPTPAGTAEVFVYYVMDAGAAGPRLYREEHEVATQGDMTAGHSAVAEMLSAAPTDPDYTSPWPTSTRLLGYLVDDGGNATVDVSSLPTGATAESIAVQQLVYTVTANDPDVKQVQLRVDGKLPSAGGLDRPISRAPRMDVQGLIWLLGPTEGATVSSPVAITGYGTAFEATVNWEVRRQGSDAVVAEGFTEAGANGEFADFSDSVDLGPGTYEMRAFESSAEDGRPLNTDTKVFTVE